jgi:hypothetical protein
VGFTGPAGKSRQQVLKRRRVRLRPPRSLGARCQGRPGRRGCTARCSAHSAAVLHHGSAGVDRRAAPAKIGHGCHICAAQKPEQRTMGVDAEHFPFDAVGQPRQQGPAQADRRAAAQTLRLPADPVADGDVDIFIGVIALLVGDIAATRRCRRNCRILGSPIGVPVGRASLTKQFQEATTSATACMFRWTEIGSAFGRNAASLPTVWQLSQKGPLGTAGGAESGFRVD